MKCESSDEEGVAGRFPVGIYLFKFNNRNTRTRCEVCSKLTIRTLERRLVSLLLILNVFSTFSIVSIVNFEQVNAG